MPVSRYVTGTVSVRPGGSTRTAHRARAAVLLLGLAVGNPTGAQQAAQTTAPPAAEGAPADGNGEHPEYRTRALPTDSFKPSEQVSEDFAVPFPADI